MTEYWRSMHDDVTGELRSEIQAIRDAHPEPCQRADCMLPFAHSEGLELSVDYWADHAPPMSAETKRQLPEFFPQQP
jgi:hypothetical protein